MLEEFDQRPLDPKAEREWRMALVEGHKPSRVLRQVMRRLPSSPRCKACNSPYAGPGGKLAALLGFRPSRKNPLICGVCIDQLPPGGLVIDIAVLFADVRGSTTVGETLPPADFAALMNRFYRTATSVLLGYDALIDKLIGDEVMALFIPGIAGPQYRRKAVSAALALAAAVREGGRLSSLPVGVAVHFGAAYVGNVGEGITDFTALGDTVNVAARLQNEAAAGQVVVSERLFDVLSASEQARAESRLVKLRGREEPLPVYLLG